MPLVSLEEEQREEYNRAHACVCINMVFSKAYVFKPKSTWKQTPARKGNKKGHPHGSLILSFFTNKSTPRRCYYLLRRFPHTQNWAHQHPSQATAAEQGLARPTANVDYIRAGHNIWVNPIPKLMLCKHAGRHQMRIKENQREETHLALGNSSAFQKRTRAVIQAQIASKASESKRPAPCFLHS